MGLDISAYAGLQLDPELKIDDDGELHPVPGVSLDNAVVLYKGHEVYEGWHTVLKTDTAYRFFETMGFRAGSYSSYNFWRNWLSALTEETRLSLEEPGDPFYEILVFSDCEGIIDETISLKLLKDFMVYDHIARCSCPQHPWLYEVYQDFTNAFRYASLHGGVVFQ